MSEIVEYYLTRLKQGDPGVGWSLDELDDSYVPELTAAYWDSNNIDVRLALLATIIEHRQPESLDFFIRAFHDKEREVWQLALNGFFVVGRNEALKVLNDLRTKLDADNRKNKQRLEWLDETIDQLEAMRGQESE